MEHDVDPDDAVRRQLAGELRLVQEAILLVAGGAAPRAMVAGMKIWPCVAIELRVTQLFEQTPGPGAAEPLA